MDMEINQTLYSWIKDLHPKDALFKGQSYLIIKRLMDLFITILSLPVWLPLIGLLALLVRIESPGSPAIFTQLRTGKNGKRFQMYKLRSMVPNAEQLKKELAHLNELQWPGETRRK